MRPRRAVLDDHRGSTEGTATMTIEHYPPRGGLETALAAKFNETILEIFGSMVGPVWHETKVELSNGAVIQAFGRGQSLRGVKHNDTRPDFCLIDDIEDEDSVKTPSAN